MATKPSPESHSTLEPDASLEPELELSALGEDETDIDKSHSRAYRAKEAWQMFARNRAAVVGVVIWVVILLTAIFGPLLYPVDPFRIVAAPMSPPGTSGALLGTDYLGRDVLAGIIHGAWVTLLTGVVSALFTVIIGALLGAVAGYYGRWVDKVLMRLTEFFQVMPPLLLAMVLVLVFSPSLVSVILAISVVIWTPVARLTRAEFLAIREQEYVKAAKAMGARDRRIIWKVIFPNAMAPLVVITTLLVGTAILFQAILAFLGLTDQNVMSWGLMIGQSRNYLLATWWAVTFPGLAILLSTLSISLIGDGLNEMLTPTRKPR